MSFNIEFFIQNDETSANRCLLSYWMEKNGYDEGSVGISLEDYFAYKNSAQYAIDQQKLIDGSLTLEVKNV